MIVCHTLDDFIEIVARLARESVGFRADATELTITLTGAF